MMVWCGMWWKRKWASIIPEAAWIGNTCWWHGYFGESVNGQRVDRVEADPWKISPRNFWIARGNRTGRLGMRLAYRFLGEMGLKAPPLMGIAGSSLAYNFWGSIDFCIHKRLSGGQNAFRKIKGGLSKSIVFSGLPFRKSPNSPISPKIFRKLIWVNIRIF